MAKKNANTNNTKFLSVREKLEFVQKNCKEPELFEDLKQLFRSKGFEKVVIEHGNQEYGKDLVFSTLDSIFNEERWYACIVKNKNASQNDFVDGGEILTQVHLAIKHPYVDHKGTKHNIAGLFIIINGAISFNAKNIMQEFVNPIILPQIQVWDYQILAGEIERNIKEIYLDRIEPVINIYHKAQLTKLSDLSTTNQLFDLKIADFEELFVNVQTTYTRKLKKLDEYVSFDSEKKGIKLNDDIDCTFEIINSSENFIIYGIATSGKSLLLRRIGIKALKPRSGLPNAVFFIDFSKVNLSELTGQIDFRAMIDSQYQELTSGESFQVQDFNKVYLLLDAIDEIKSTEIKKNIISNIDSLKDHPLATNIQYVFTIRSLELLQENNWLVDFEKIELLPFNIGQALKLVNKIIPNNKAKSDTFVKALRSSLLSSGILRTPLALTLMAILYRDDQIDPKELPANITELYNKFVDTYLDRWDTSKGILRQYQYEQTKLIIAFIALHLNCNGMTFISEENLKDFLISVKKQFTYEALNEIDHFIEHLKFGNGVFNYDEPSNTFAFFNHYFQEYFVSIAIDDSNEKILNENFFSDWWGNSIVFYCGRQPRRDAFLKNACDNISPLDIQDKYSYLQLVSTSLQATHAISVASRLKVVDRLVTEFDNFYIKAIEDGKKGQTIAIFQTTMTLIINLREFFEKLFASKHISTEETLNYLENLLIGNPKNLADVTRYSIAYFVSFHKKNPTALEIFIDDESLPLFWNRVVFVDINFLKFKKDMDRSKFLRIKRKMTKNKFSIIDKMKGISTDNLQT
jgi:hypothetical protein